MGDDGYDIKDNAWLYDGIYANGCLDRLYLQSNVWRLIMYRDVFCTSVYVIGLEIYRAIDWNSKEKKSGKFAMTVDCRTEYSIGNILEFTPHYGMTR